MQKIEWAESYAIGVGVIDYQHRKLIRLIGDLQEYQTKIEFHDDVIDLILEELCDYTEYHFTTEEKFMEQISYSEIEQHKIKHLNFAKQLKVFKKGFQEREANVTNDLINFLTKWLLNHIAIEDVQIKQYITQAGGLV